MSRQQLEPDTPEARAAMLAEAIRHAACLEGEISAYSLMRHVAAWSGIDEEESIPDAMNAIFILMTSGLFKTNTYDAATDSYGLGPTTVLTASRDLIEYVHGEFGVGEGDVG